MTFQILEVTLPKTEEKSSEGAKSRASKFWFMTIWFWNVCEKEYYNCDPVNVGFGQKFPRPF